MLLDEPRDSRQGPVTMRSLGTAVALHVLAFLFFWAASRLFFRTPDMIIPIDMTVVPPWAQQTDDPEPDPNPPPKPEEVEKPKPLPKPPEPETKPEEPKVEAVEKVVEKKKPEKVDLRKNAKLLKTPPRPKEEKSLKDTAKLIKAPPQRRTGTATAHDKPLSPEEFMRKMNEGYRIGTRNQVADGEMQRCISIIAAAIRREWEKESFKWYPGLVPIQVALQLGPTGEVRGFRIAAGSGDKDVDRTASAALRRLQSNGRIVGLSATFLSQFPELGIVMEPTSAR